MKKNINRKFLEKQRNYKDRYIVGNEKTMRSTNQNDTKKFDR